ncbi:MAG: LytTR family transcriptional regulator [Robiginitomaculum sp.]|nr:LytTR family transcriptional regulator [Robiginitomaculum sp.]
MIIRKFFQSDIKASDTVTGERSFLDELILLGAVFALVLLRPFGMSNISFAQSVVYWLLICVIGYCLFSLVFFVYQKTLARCNWKYPYPLIVATGVSGLLMSSVVPLIWSMFFGLHIVYTDAFFRILPQILIISTLIVLVSMTTDHIKRQRRLLTMNSSEQDNQNAIQMFMKKLPRKIQGELLCIRADDHYLKVHTDKGKHMLLMPLINATKELEGAKGLRVHRSWWVNENAVLGSVKSGNKISLILKNNISVPVSRSYLKQVKDKNLL